ncbi:MAG: hypothetical protein ACI4XL_04850 [Bacillus sp. (in: firmicutes)]
MAIRHVKVREDFFEYLQEGESAEKATRLILDEYKDEFPPEELPGIQRGAPTQALPLYPYIPATQ